MKEKNVANHEEGEEVEVRDDEVFEVEETPLFYTRATGHYLQNLWRKRLNHTGVVKRAGGFLQKRPSLL